VKKIFEWFGGTKVGLCFIILFISTALYVLGLIFEWNGKGMTADDWCSLAKWLALFAVGGNAIGMGIHAFAKNPVSTVIKKNIENGE
jgi:hypothetical protein